MAKKINLNVAKEFLFNHGEKVALGTCAFLALLFTTLGLMDALGAGKSPDTGKPWADELMAQQKRIQVSLDDPQVPKLPAETDAMLKAEQYQWPPVPLDWPQQRYINTPELNNDKRQNPRALAIRSGKKAIRLDYVPALVHKYEKFEGKEAVKVLLEKAGGGGGGLVPPGGGNKKPGMGAPNPGAGAGAGQTRFYREGDPRRMIIGYAVFPLKDQVAEFQRALKYASQKEMFDAPREDLPTFAGFNLLKYEVLPDGAKKDPEVMLMWNGKELKVADRLKKFLSMAMFDEKSASDLEPFIYAGLTMPLPQLAYGDYPKIDLEGGIKSAEDTEGKEEMKGPKKGLGNTPKGGIMPGPKGGMPKAPGDKEGAKDAVEYTVIGMPRKELKAAGPFELALDGRLFDSDFNYFHALGQKATPAGEEAPKNQPGMKPPGAGGLGAVQGDRYFAGWDITKTGEVGPDGKLPEGQPGMKKPPMAPGLKGSSNAPADQGPAYPSWDRDAVLRFIDVDVEPGKTYRYEVQIRLKNPNFERTKSDVAYAALTQIPELLSEWVPTEPITIPGDYFLYAVDQNLLDEVKTPLSETKKDATTFQIHQWTTKSAGSEDQRISYPIGDWVVAERVLVQKGSPIGFSVLVNAPFWKSELDAFDVKKGVGKAPPGIKIDMAPPILANPAGDTPFPLLVDFVGGKRKVTPNALAEEDVAVDALILGPDGKLRVLNSRDAAENRPDPGANLADAAKATPARNRQARLIHTRERAAEISGATTTGSNTQKKGGPVLPGTGGGN